MIMFGTLGIGIIGMYQQVLDNAVRDAARQVQIDDVTASTASNFKNGLCSAGLGAIVSGCSNSTLISFSVQASSVAIGFAGLTPEAVSATGTLSNSFFAGTTKFGPNVNVLVQVCFQIPFNIPYFSIALTGTNSNCLYSTSAVRVEPYT